MAQKNLGLCMLMDGDLVSGARAYEWRWKTREFRPRGFDQPLWDGAEFAGKTLLLHTEQGLGDTIQFVRHAAQKTDQFGLALDHHPATPAASQGCIADELNCVA